SRSASASNAPAVASSENSPSSTALRSVFDPQNPKASCMIASGLGAPACPPSADEISACVLMRLYRPQRVQPSRSSYDPIPRLSLSTGLHLWRSEEHTSELQSRGHLVCRLLLEKKKKTLIEMINEREQVNGSNR